MYEKASIAARRVILNKPNETLGLQNVIEWLGERWDPVRVEVQANAIYVAYMKLRSQIESAYIENPPDPANYWLAMDKEWLRNYRDLESFFDLTLSVQMERDERNALKVAGRRSFDRPQRSYSRGATSSPSRTKRVPEPQKKTAWLPRPALRGFSFILGP